MDESPKHSDFCKELGDLETPEDNDVLSSKSSQSSRSDRLKGPKKFQADHRNSAVDLDGSRMQPKILLEKLCIDSNRSSACALNLKNSGQNLVRTCRMENEGQVSDEVENQGELVTKSRSPVTSSERTKKTSRTGGANGYEKDDELVGSADRTVSEKQWGDVNTVRATSVAHSDPVAVSRVDSEELPSGFSAGSLGVSENCAEERNESEIANNNVCNQSTDQDTPLQGRTDHINSKRLPTAAYEDCLDDKEVLVPETSAKTSACNPIRTKLYVRKPVSRKREATPGKRLATKQAQEIIRQRRAPKFSFVSHDTKHVRLCLAGKLQAQKPLSAQRKRFNRLSVKTVFQKRGSKTEPSSKTNSAEPNRPSSRTTKFKIQRYTNRVTYHKPCPIKSRVSTNADDTESQSSGPATAKKNLNNAPDYVTAKARPMKLHSVSELANQQRPAASPKRKPVFTEVPPKFENSCRSVFESFSDQVASKFNRDDETHVSSNTDSFQVEYRDNIFEKFRSPMQADDGILNSECLNLSKRRPSETYETGMSLLISDKRQGHSEKTVSSDAHDIKEILGDYDSDSTECCKYEDLDQFLPDTQVPENCRQLELLEMNENFYPGFSPFHLQSDSDDNLVVDESTDIHVAAPPQVIEPEKKLDENVQNSDKPKTSMKLRPTAPRTYTKKKKRVVEQKLPDKYEDKADLNVERVPEKEVDTNIEPMDAGVTSNSTGEKELTARSTEKGKGKIKTMQQRKGGIRKTTTPASHPSKRDTFLERKKTQRSQKMARVCKEFATRSKTRSKIAGRDEPVKKRAIKDQGQGTKTEETSCTEVVTDQPLNAVEGLENSTEVDVVKRNSVKKPYKRQNRLSSDQSSKPKKSPKRKKKNSSSNAKEDQPPKIDILSRELGPRYNWLEQKIQAMQRSCSEDCSEKGQGYHGHGQQAATTEPTKRSFERSVESDEESRPSKVKRLSQADVLNDCVAPSCPPAAGDQLAAGYAPESALLQFQNCSSRQEAYLNLSQGGSSAPSEAAFVSSDLPTVRTASADSESAASLPILSNIISQTSTPSPIPTALPLRDAECEASYDSGFPSFSCSPTYSFRRQCQSRRSDPSLSETFSERNLEDVFETTVIGRSLSLTNLNEVSDTTYVPEFLTRPSMESQVLDAAPFLPPDCNAPFDLSLPSAKKTASSEARQSDLYCCSPEINLLGHPHLSALVNTQHGSNLSEEEKDLPKSDNISEKQVVLDESMRSVATKRKGSGVLEGAEKDFIIDLTLDGEPAAPYGSSSACDTSQQEPQAKDSFSSPVIRSLKYEYARRLEMYERLIKVSKIKDQEIAILDSERKRVKNELDCLKNLFLKATTGVQQEVELHQDARIPRSLSSGGSQGQWSNPAESGDNDNTKEAHSRESTARLMASRTPPDAHSAKMDLSSYSYIKYQFGRKDPAKSSPVMAEVLRNSDGDVGPVPSGLREQFSSEPSICPYPDKTASDNDLWGNSPQQGHIPALISDSDAVPKSFLDQAHRSDDRAVDFAMSRRQHLANTANLQDTTSKPLSSLPEPLFKETVNDNQRLPDRKPMTAEEPITKLPPPTQPGFYKVEEDDRSAPYMRAILDETSDTFTQSVRESPLRDLYPRRKLEQPGYDEESRRSRSSSSWSSKDGMTKVDRKVYAEQSRVEMSTDRKMEDAARLDHSEPQAVDLSQGGGSSMNSKGLRPSSVTYPKESLDERVRALLGRDSGSGVASKISNENLETPVALDLKMTPPNTVQVKKVGQTPRLVPEEVRKYPEEAMMAEYAAYSSRGKPVPDELSERGNFQHMSNVKRPLDDTKAHMSEPSRKAIQQNVPYSVREGKERTDIPVDMKVVSRRLDGYRKTAEVVDRPRSGGQSLLAGPGASSGSAGVPDVVDPAQRSHLMRKLVPEVVSQEQTLRDRRLVDVITVDQTSMMSDRVPGETVPLGERPEANHPMMKHSRERQPAAYPERLSSNLHDMSLMVRSISKSNSSTLNPSEQRISNMPQHTPGEVTDQRAVACSESSSNDGRAFLPRPHDRGDRRPVPHYQTEPEQPAIYRRSSDLGPRYMNPTVVGGLPASDMELQRMQLQELNNPSGGQFKPPSIQHGSEIQQQMGNHQARQSSQAFNPGVPPTRLSHREAGLVPSRIPVEQVPPHQVPPDPNAGRRVSSEAHHMRKQAAPAPISQHNPQIQNPGPIEGPSQRRYHGNVPVHLQDPHMGQHVNRYDQIPLPVLRKSGSQPDTQVRPDNRQEIPGHRVPSQRNPGPPPSDARRVGYPVSSQSRTTSEPQREMAVPGKFADESTVAHPVPSNHSRNESMVVNRILRQELPGRAIRNYNRSGLPEAENKEARPGIEASEYRHQIPDNDPARVLGWRPNQGVNHDYRGVMRAAQEGHPQNPRLPDDRAGYMDKRAVAHPVPGELAPGAKDQARDHPHGVASLAADRYLPTYGESLSTVSQGIPFRNGGGMVPSVHGNLVRQPTKDDAQRAQALQARHRDHPRFPISQPPTVFADNLRLLPHNAMAYGAQPGIISPGFDPGKAGPAAPPHGERVHLRPPGFDHQRSPEYFPAAAAYAAFDRSQMNGVRVAPQTSPVLSASQVNLPRPQLRPEELQFQPPGIKPNQPMVQTTVPADSFKVQQQQQMQPFPNHPVPPLPSKVVDYVCDVCRKPAMFVCSACKGVAYCSTECQAISWQKKHSAVCRQT